MYHCAISIQNVLWVFIIFAKCSSVKVWWGNTRNLRLELDFFVIWCFKNFKISMRLEKNRWSKLSADISLWLFCMLLVYKSRWLVIEKVFAMVPQNVSVYVPKAVRRQIMNPDNNKKCNTEGCLLFVVS